MKKISLILTMLTISIFSAFAQDEKLDEYSFETEPLKEETTPYFAVGGGYTGTFKLLNFDDINTKLVSNYGMDKMDGYLYMHGFDAFTGIVIVPNMRVGFSLNTGSKLVEKDITLTEGGADKQYTRSSELNIMTTAFSVDYGIVAFKNMAIVPSLQFGWGSIDLDNYQAPKSAADWASIDKDNLNSYNHRISRSIMYVQPGVNFEYAVTGFLCARLSASYTIDFANPLSKYEAKLNKTTEVKNLPDGFSAKGLNLQFGIFVGLFNY